MHEKITFPRSVPQSLLLKTLVNYIEACYEDTGWNVKGNRNSVVAKKNQLIIEICCP